jgi:hypothetical protein
MVLRVTGRQEEESCHSIWLLSTHPDDHDPSLETETMAMVKASERRRKDNSR